MKKITLLLLLSSFLCSCNNSIDNSIADVNTSVFPITYVFMDFHETEESYYKSYYKCFDDSSSINYVNEDGKVVSLNYNIDDLIGGDAVIITHYNDYLILEMYPSIVSIQGNIINIEVQYATIYEVTLHKNDNEISFSLKDNSETLDLSFLNEKEYIISQLEGEIIRNHYDDYADNTTLYLAYNHHLSKADRYAYLYDYNPK